MELALKCKMGRAGKTSNRFLSFSPHILFTFLFALSLCASGALAREETVKAFLIPHSHCDPGWLETYEVPSFIRDFFSNVCQFIFKKLV
jgi:hypothetical protein